MKAEAETTCRATWLGLLERVEDTRQKGWNVALFNVAFAGFIITGLVAAFLRPVHRSV